jgi:hypothetical protein
MESIKNMLLSLLDRQFLGNSAQAYPYCLLTASPWAYNGHVFVMSEEGDTFVIDAGNEYRLVGTNSLDDFSMATPAIVGDRLLIRTQHRLYSIRNRQ